MKLSEKQKEMLLVFIADCILDIRSISWYFYHEPGSKTKIEMLSNLIHDIPYFINRDDFEFSYLYRCAKSMDKIFSKNYTAIIKTIENTV